MSAFLRLSFPEESSTINKNDKNSENNENEKINNNNDPNNILIVLQANKNVADSSIEKSLKENNATNSSEKLKISLQKLLKNTEIRKAKLSEIEKLKEEEKNRINNQKKNFPNVIKKVLILNEAKKVLEGLRLKNEKSGKNDKKDLNDKNDTPEKVEKNKTVEENGKEKVIGDEIITAIDEKENMSPNKSNGKNINNLKIITGKIMDKNKKGSDGGMEKENESENNSPTTKSMNTTSNATSNTTSWESLINRRSAVCSSIQAKKERKAIIEKIQKDKKEKSNGTENENDLFSENNNPIKKLLEKRTKKIEKSTTVSGILSF